MGQLHSTHGREYDQRDCAGVAAGLQMGIAGAEPQARSVDRLLRAFDGRAFENVAPAGGRHLYVLPAANYEGPRQAMLRLDKLYANHSRKAGVRSSGQWLGE